MLVVKIGGSQGVDIACVLRDVASIVARGERVVVVLGASHETSELALKLGHPPRFITSPSGHTSRRTDRQTLEIFAMAARGLIGVRAVETLRALGVDALALSGVDGGLWIGRRKDAIRAVEDGRTVMVRDDYSGRVERVDGALLRALLDLGRTLVLTPPAITEDGIAINVDADRAASATAAALGADELVLLSNVAGVLRDPSDPSSLIADASAFGIENVRAAAKGRMMNKVLAAEEAIAGGVRRVVIGAASGQSPVSAARAGAGTIFEAVGA